MQIVIEKTTNKAIYLFTDFEPIEITEAGMTTSAKRAMDIRSSTHEVVMGDGPEFWVSGALSYNGVWAVIDSARYQKMLAVKRSAKREAIIRDYETALAPLESAYPQKERDTWPQQVTEARAFVENAQASMPLVDALLTSRSKGESKAVLTAKIINNYTAYSGIVGAALGTMQTRLLALEAAQTLEQIQAV